MANTPHIHKATSAASMAEMAAVALQNGPTWRTLKQAILGGPMGADNAQGAPCAEVARASDRRPPLTERKDVYPTYMPKLLTCMVAHNMLAN